MKENESLATTLFVVGITLLGIGIVRLVAPGSILIYVPTGEKIQTKTYNHHQGLEGEVEHALAKGRVDSLKNLAAKENAPLVTVTYTTASGSLFAGQTLHYVPYEYEPISKVYIIEKTDN